VTSMARDDILFIELTREEIFLMASTFMILSQAKMSGVANLGDNKVAICPETIGLALLDGESELSREWLCLYFTPETVEHMMENMSEAEMQQLVGPRWTAIQLSIQIKLSRMAKRAVEEYPELFEMIRPEEERLEGSAQAVKDQYEFVIAGVYPPIIGEERN